MRGLANEKGGVQYAKSEDRHKAVYRRGEWYMFTIRLTLDKEERGCSARLVKNRRRPPAARHTRDGPAFCTRVDYGGREKIVRRNLKPRHSRQRRRSWPYAPYEWHGKARYRLAMRRGGSRPHRAWHIQQHRAMGIKRRYRRADRS